MIGLDTNVLLRFLIKDDEVQGQKASRAIRQAAAGAEPVFISLVVLCEAVWVLESAYGYRKAQLAQIVGELLATGGFEVEQRDVVREALDDYGSSNADFSDCLVGRVNVFHGCRQSLTFDRSLKALDAFRVL